MATLTETAYYTRKGVIWLSLATVAFFILRFAVLWAIEIYKQANPPPPPSPTMDFGKLPGIAFPQTEVTPSLSYRLETKEGGLPHASSSAHVYFIPRQLPNLLASERAKKFAAQLGFTGEPIKKKATLFRFDDTSYPRTLTLDTVTNNFTLRFDYASNPQVLGTPPLNRDQAVADSGEFFRQLRIFPSTIDDNLTRTQLLRHQQGKLVEATSLAATQAIRVDFFHQDIDGTPVVTPNFVHSLIYTIYTGNKNEATRFIEIGFTYFPIDTSINGTYPIKSTETAWGELNQGKGYIANRGKVGKEAIIRHVYLAYYQSPDYQAYLQPIFVFEGDKQFAAYVPAITKEGAEPPKLIRSHQSTSSFR